MHIDDVTLDMRLRAYRRAFDTLESYIDGRAVEAKQQFRYAFFLRYYAIFENQLKVLCDRFATKLSLPLRLADISGENFLKRVNKYLTHVAKFDPLDKHHLWGDVLAYLWIRNLIIHSDGRVAHHKDIPQYVSRQFRQRASGLKLSRQNTIRLNRNFLYRAVSRMAAVLLEIGKHSSLPPEEWSNIDEVLREIKGRSGKAATTSTKKPTS